MLWLLLQPSVRDAFGISPHRQAATVKPSERPTGVKFLAVLFGLAAVGWVLAGIAYAVTLPSWATDLSADPATLRAMRVATVYGTIPWATGYAACALGLWRLRNWGRLLAIVFATFWLLPLIVVVGFFLLQGMTDLFSILAMMIAILLLGSLPGWTLWYLFRPQTRRLFATKPAATS